MSLDELKKQKEELLKKLSNPEFLSNREKFEEASRELKTIEEKIFLFKEIEKLDKKINEAQEILKEANETELIDLANEEINKNLEKKQNIIEKLQKIEEKENENSDLKNNISGVILEIRPGTGGEEAALFASDLFRMYQKYANQKNWPVRIIDLNLTSLNGLKEGVLEIKSASAYEDLQYEAGVHRVQRIPVTEKSGRVHTSTATVAVIPQVKNPEIEIKPSDLEISFFRSSGPGGQNVQKVETAVRIIHKPTGLIVSCQSERSQSQNKEKALSVLRSKLHQLAEQEKAKTMDELKGKKIKIEWGNQVRSYILYPYKMIRDEKTGQKNPRVEEVLEGNLDLIN